MKLAEEAVLEKACSMVEKEAKAVIGTYDYGWPQLAESTQEQRSRLGYAANEPLLREGHMRDSISHVVVPSEHAGYVGSTSKIAAYQELGTGRIPPRSLLAGATMHKEHEIHEMMGRAMAGVMMRGGAILSRAQSAFRGDT
jgi:hypothetical protein